MLLNVCGFVKYGTDGGKEPYQVTLQFNCLTLICFGFQKRLDHRSTVVPNQTLTQPGSYVKIVFVCFRRHDIMTEYSFQNCFPNELT